MLRAWIIGRVTTGQNPRSMRNKKPQRGRSSSAPRRRSGNQRGSKLLGKKAAAVARQALEELDEGGVGSHVGARVVDPHTAIHRFAADVPGYPDWEWIAVVACAPGSAHITVSELALMPADGVTLPPRFVPYAERIRPGDLTPGTVMPPAPDDSRLTKDSQDAAFPEHKGDSFLSKHGWEETTQRWRQGAFGPRSRFARKAALRCSSCAFFVPLAVAQGAYGVCANEFSADGHAVHRAYGCGAHSETPAPPNVGVPHSEVFDDERPVSI